MRKLLTLTATLFGAALLTGCGGSSTDQAAQTPAAPGAATTQTDAHALPAVAFPGKYVVAAADPRATAAGEEMLRKGGSAVDAAIAVQAVLGLVEPQSSGIGGGAFMMHYDASKNLLESYDGREVAPASATPDMFLDENGQPMKFYDAVVGGRSVGVPGVLAMLKLAHDEHGRLPWADLFQPAIKLASEGFIVSPRLHGLLARPSKLKTMPGADTYFYDADGNARPVGYKLKNPAYAESLTLIANDGPDAFYKGPIAKEIVDAVSHSPLNPTPMTLDDLANYKPEKRTPVCGVYRTYKICGMGPPSSGGVTVIETLQILQHFDMSALTPMGVKAVFLMIEAQKLAYADRNVYLADSDFLSGEGAASPEAIVHGLISPAYAAARARLIDPEKANADVQPGDPTAYENDPEATPPGAIYAPDTSQEPPSTSHFVVRDGDGDVVSMTTTIEGPFGSHLMAGGMLLNNQLTDFSFLPEKDGKPVANAVAPGKRPRSSMSPTIMFNPDGSVYAAVGSPGGPAIIGFVLKTLVGVIDWHMDMQPAMNLPHVVVPRGAPFVEKGKFDPSVIEALNAMGEDVKEYPLTSGLHGFRITPDGIDAGADTRREGNWVVGDTPQKP